MLEDMKGLGWSSMVVVIVVRIVIVVPILLILCSFKVSDIALMTIFFLPHIIQIKYLICHDYREKDSNDEHDNSEEISIDQNEEELTSDITELLLKETEDNEQTCGLCIHLAQ